MRVHEIVFAFRFIQLYRINVRFSLSRHHNASTVSKADSYRAPPDRGIQFVCSWVEFTPVTVAIQIIW